MCSDVTPALKASTLVHFKHGLSGHVGYDTQELFSSLTCTQLVHFIMVENVIYLTLLGPSAVGKSTLAGRMIHQV